MTTNNYLGLVDGRKMNSGYVRAKNSVEAKRKIRKMKKCKGVKHIKVLECLS